MRAMSARWVYDTSSKPFLLREGPGTGPSKAQLDRQLNGAKWPLLLPLVSSQLHRCVANHAQPQDLQLFAAGLDLADFNHHRELAPRQGLLLRHICRHKHTYVDRTKCSEIVTSHLPRCHSKSPPCFELEQQN